VAKKYKRMKHILFLFSLLFSLQLMGETRIVNQKTEYQRNPVGLDVQKPRFSWEMQSDARAKKQTSYQITVSKDSDFENIIWDSGQTTSDKSVHIAYEGPTLEPATRYYWRVSVWDENNAAIQSTENSFFETGLMNSGWGNARWLKISGAEEIPKYTIEMDFEIKDICFGPCFAAKDEKNFYMWQINIGTAGKTLLRPHVYTNGGASVFSQTDITSKINLQANQTYSLRIEIDGKVAKTYINDILVATITRSENFGYGNLGFRYSFAGDVSEKSYADNIKVTDKDGKVLFQEDFGGSLFYFSGGTLVDGRLYLDSGGKSEQKVWQTGKDVPRFRHEFTLSKTIESARIYTSGLGVYDVYINGKRVGTPLENGNCRYDELKPGWTDYRKTVFYSTYDVTGLLATGNNAVGAYVTSGWLTGYVAHGKYGAPPLGFLAKLIVRYTDGTTESVYSDTNWKSSTAGPLMMGNIYNGEIYDARKESNWTTPGYDDSDWQKTEVNDYFQGNITAFVGPAVQVRPELERAVSKITVYEGSKSTGTTYGEINVKNEVSGFETIQLKEGQTAVFDMAQNMVGWVNFTVRGNAGTQMKFRFAEILNDTGNKSRGDDGPKGSLYTASLRTAKASLYYTLKGDPAGESYHSSSTFFGFRYCEITATDDVDILGLRGEVVGTANEETASFKTSNSSVNQLYNNVIWSQRGNFLSIPTDCPQRDERLGWTGDAQVFCRTAAYNADVASFFHKWMGDMRDGQEDGGFPDIAPIVWLNRWGNAAWADAGIIVPWTIYQMYDDIRILEENYEAMEKHMTYLASQADGAYLYNGGGVTYGDWLNPESTEQRYISVCYYAYDAKLMSKMSLALSTAANDSYALKAAAYETLFQNIKSEFQTRYLNANGTLKQTTQTAYLFALKLELFRNNTEVEAAVKFLRNKISNNGNKLSTGFVGTSMINQILSRFNQDDMAYNLLLQRNNPSWLYSVDQGATTIWERWDSYTIAKGFNTVDMNSFNHYSYGAVAEWMFRYMGGIDLDEDNPGFKHIILQPTPDNRTSLPAQQERITKVEAKHNSYYGEIGSSWTRKSDGRITYSAVVPANTTATLYLPVIDNEDVIYEGNTPADQAEGVTFVKIENGKAIYRLQSGKYSFKVEVPGYNSIETNELLKPFAIYPNPVKNQLVIGDTEKAYAIYDLTGEKISSGKKSIVDVSDLKAGSYIIQAEEYVGKFIKISK
jgi:alpha-L-rhamnosidase